MQTTFPSPSTAPTSANHRIGLAELVAALRQHAQMAQEQSRLAREIQQLRAAARMLEVGKPGRAKAAEAAMDLARQRELALHANTRALLAQRPSRSPTVASEPDDGEWVWRALWQGLAKPSHSVNAPNAEPPHPGAVSATHNIDPLLARLATGQSIDEAVAHLTLALGPDAMHDALQRATRHLSQTP